MNVWFEGSYNELNCQFCRLIMLKSWISNNGLTISGTRVRRRGICQQSISAIPPPPLNMLNTLRKLYVPAPVLFSVADAPSEGTVLTTQGTFRSLIRKSRLNSLYRHVYKDNFLKIEAWKCIANVTFYILLLTVC